MTSTSIAPERTRGVRDLQRLLAGIRLGDQQIVYIDAELAGIGRVERVLGIDEGTSPAAALRLGDDVQCQGSSCLSFPGP